MLSEEVWGIKHIAKHLDKEIKTIYNTGPHKNKDFPDPIAANRWYRSDVITYLKKQGPGRPRAS